MNKQEEIINMCVAFAVRINNLRKYLKKEQHEHNLQPTTYNIQHTICNIQ